MWTIPEVLKARYGNTTRIISTLFLLLGLIALFGVQVAALGTVFTAIGAGATLGTGGLAYNVGIVALWSIFAYALGLIGFSFIAGDLAFLAIGAVLTCGGTAWLLSRTDA